MAGEQRIQTAEAIEVASLVEEMPERLRRQILVLIRGITRVASEALDTERLLRRPTPPSRPV